MPAHCWPLNFGVAALDEHAYYPHQSLAFVGFSGHTSKSTRHCTLQLVITTALPHGQGVDLFPGSKGPERRWRRAHCLPHSMGIR
jgi:hypothetical protein